MMTMMINQAPKNNPTIPPMPMRKEFHGAVMQDKEKVQEGKCTESHDDDNKDDIVSGWVD